MKKDIKLYFEMFRASFCLSAFTFGGGYVIVPLMRKRFVDEKHWIEDEEMIEIVAIAQSAPGVIAVNASILAGYRIAGVAGSFITTLATILPPLIIITVVASFYEAFRGNAAVSAAMRAMQAGVAAVIVDAVYNMGGSVVKGKGFKPLLVIALCFCASYIFGINAAIIILTCGVLGAVMVLMRDKKSRDGGTI